MFDPSVASVLRENLVETVGDLAFLAHSESALGRLGFEPMTAVDVWDHLKPVVEALMGDGDDMKPEPEPEPAPAPKSIFARKRQAKASEASAERDLGADVGEWLVEVGAGECETAFRENMVETLGDVAFLVNSRSDLAAMGLSTAQAGRLWDHVAALSASGGSGVDTGVPTADPDEDISTWLLSNGASDCEEAMRHAMIETVGDIHFMVNSKADLTGMGLSNAQVETIWSALDAVRSGRSSPAFSSGDGMDKAILGMDAAEWLADHGQGSAEAVLREHMIETVADLTFLISSQNDMAKLGFAPAAQQDLWPDIAKLSALASADEPRENPIPKKVGKKKAPPQATGEYKPDVGGKNDPRLGWGALAGDDAANTPKKTKGGKKKTSSKASDKNAERTAAAAEARKKELEEKAAKELAKKEEAKAKREAQKAAEAEKKAKAIEARKQKKAAAEEKKQKQVQAKKSALTPTEPAVSPKASPKKTPKSVADRLAQPTTRGVGNETPKSSAEMSPKPKKGKVKPPRCATVPIRGEERDATADFSPQLDWAVQRKLLDKIEQETRRREHLQWLKEKKQKEEEQAAAERAELRATYDFELHGPPKLDVVNPALARAKKKPTQFKMSPGSAKMVDNDGLTFVERQELRLKQRQEKMEARKKELEERELAEVTAQPALSKASLRMTKETIHASLSREERMERLTSPVRQRSPKAAEASMRPLGSPPRTTSTPGSRKKSTRLGSPQASAAERLSKTSSRDRLRKEGQAHATDLTFQPAINNSSRDMATRRRSPRGARNLGSPSRSGVASALSSIKTNIKTVWDQPGGVNIEKLFEHYDKDQDGWLSFSEWTRAIRRDGIAVGSGQHLSDEEHRQIFDYVDVDQDGYISLSEFRQFLQPKSRRRTTSGARSPAADSPRSSRGPRPSPQRTPIAPADRPLIKPAASLGAPQPPTTLPAASAELIEHCAEWVARHGQQFETILKNRNFGQPGPSSQPPRLPTKMRCCTPLS